MPAVLTKMALDQLLMAPLFLVVFFFATKTLEGLPHKLPGVDKIWHALLSMVPLPVEMSSSSSVLTLCM